MGLAGNITDEDDTFFIGNGQMRYDAMATVVWARSDIGAFHGEGSFQAADLTDQQWRVAQTTTDGTFTETFNAIRVRYLHRYGYNKLVVSGFAWQNNSTSGGSYNFGNHIRAEVNGFTESTPIDSSSASDFTIEVGLGDGGADLAPGELYTITVSLRCLTNGGGGTAFAQTYLREDVVIIATT